MEAVMNSEPANNNFLLKIQEKRKENVKKNRNLLLKYWCNKDAIQTGLCQK